MAGSAFGLEFGSAARLSKRLGSLWNCLWGHALKRSPGINSKSRVLYPGPRFQSSSTWPSLLKKRYNGLIIILLGRSWVRVPAGSYQRPSKNYTNCFPAKAHMHWGRSLTVQPDCLKGQVVCGTVYADMHLKDLLGSFVRVGYRIPVPDFYLVLHGLRCHKSAIMN